MIPPLALVLAMSVSLGGASDSRKAFTESWRGARVVVQRPLYTLVYDEHGHLGRTYRGKREGLTVVAPKGMFFRFDGRDSEPDLVGSDPQHIMDRIAGLYRRSKLLDEGSFERIEASGLVRHQPGVVMVVRDVRVERSRVRLLLADAPAGGRDGQIATTLTVDWPLDLSPEFTERADIEALIGQFLARENQNAS